MGKKLTDEFLRYFREWGKNYKWRRLECTDLEVDILRTLKGLRQTSWISLMPDKRLERWYLEALRRARPELPSGPPEEPEPPDFVLTEGTRRLGIELTTFHLPPARATDRTKSNRV